MASALTITLCLIAIATVACSGPKPTSIPLFFKMGNSVDAIAHDGTVWVGTDNDGVARFDGGDWTTYTEDDGLASNSINALAVAPDGTVWAGTHSGVSRFAGRLGSSRTHQDKAWITYTSEHGLAPTGIASIVAAPDNSVWVSYYGWTYGISRFDGESPSTNLQRDAWTTYTEDDGLPSNEVTAIAVAPDGALWVGTAAGTISRFAGDAWTTYNVSDITPR
jgi:ligand-binding sensor domain-containing protein